MPGLEIHLLGPPLVKVDGAPLAVDTRKAIALLAYLAVTGRPHSRDALADLLWPGSEPESVRAALRRTLSVLRRGLGDRWLRVRRDSLALDVQEIELDVARFRVMLREGRPSEAVELARGDFMEGFGLRDSPAFDDWQLAETQAFRRELASALELLALADAEQGRLLAALEHGRRRLALDPLAEPAHRLLIRLYAWAGDRAAAIEQYRHCVRMLHHELGVPPVEETTALYEAVSEGRVPTPVKPAPAEAPARAESPYPLVGRTAELEELIAAWSPTVEGGRLLVIEGEAGIGKTRLADELAGRVRSRGGEVLAVRAREGEAELPYAAVAEALRLAVAGPGAAERLDAAPAHALEEAGRLVPEVALLAPGAAPPPPIEGPGGRGRFVAGLADVLCAAGAGEPPGLLLVDDAQWADAPSLEVLAYLARRIERRPVRLLLAWRREDVQAGHPLRQLLDETARGGLATVVSPGRLLPDAVAELAQVAGLATEAERIHAETGGLPLAVVEYLAALKRGEEGSPPAGIIGLLRARASSVREVPGQVLAAGAVLGAFDLDAVRDTSGRGDDETVEALEELVRRALLVESADGYRFAHEQLREVVYGDTSLARRRLLHRRAAETLAAQSRRAGGPRAGLVAEHYRLAGRDAEAAEYHRRAGEQARSLCANAEAVSHLQAALALGHPDEVALHEAIGELQTLQAEYGLALRSLETAAALAADGAALARVEHRLGVLRQRRGEWEGAAGNLDAAARYAAGNPALAARIEADRSLNEHRRGRREEAVELARRALRLAEEAGDPRSLAQAHNLLGILASSQGDPGEARRQLERSLEIAGRLRDPGARAAALNNLALVAGAELDLERALELARGALELCAAQGDRHREAALHNNLADLLHSAGRQEEAMAHLKHAVAIFAEIGVDADEPLPEIWKLVEW